MPEPVFDADGVMLYVGDCREVMRELPEESVDAIVTDPPYGLEFMGKEWDRLWDNRANTEYRRKGFGPGVLAAPNYEAGIKAQEWHYSWAVEALRVLKPGGHMVAFGGTRTFHRLTCAIEDAGFEIRDCLMWLYGQGFPKSRNLDSEWQGWGTALKPAWEPILLARKPLSGTVAANVQRWGTGAINVDACRIEIDSADDIHAKNPHTFGTIGAKGIYNDGKPVLYDVPPGRWPANLVLDEEAAAMLDAQSGERRSPMPYVFRGKRSGGYGGDIGLGIGHDQEYGDSGGPSRFFYTAKAGPDERGGGKHPTVKPLALMRWLCKLITPPDGLILDPFIGSGTTAVAARMEGFRCIGIDTSEEYIAHAVNRLQHGDAVMRRLAEARRAGAEQATLWEEL